MIDNVVALFPLERPTYRFCCSARSSTFPHLFGVEISETALRDRGRLLEG